MVEGVEIQRELNFTWEYWGVVNEKREEDIPHLSEVKDRPRVELIEKPQIGYFVEWRDVALREGSEDGGEEFKHLLEVGVVILVDSSQLKHRWVELIETDYEGRALLLVVATVEQVIELSDDHELDVLLKWRENTGIERSGTQVSNEWGEVAVAVVDWRVVLELNEAVLDKRRITLAGVTNRLSLSLGDVSYVG